MKNIESDSDTPLIVIADLHGHLALFELMLRWVDARYPRARIVTLGDYVDNGPQIPALLDRLIRLRAERPQRFFPILGNHDLALLRSLGWPGDRPDWRWYERWQERYWNPGMGTAAAYRATDLDDFARRFPAAHYRLLASMPWYYDDGRYFCVHAGLQQGPIAPQRDALREKQLPQQHLHLPPVIRDRDLATSNDPAWDRVVISAHRNLGNQQVFQAPQRICVSATADHGGGLLAVVLPERRGLLAERSGVSDFDL